MSNEGFAPQRAYMGRRELDRLTENHAVFSLVPVSRLRRTREPSASHSRGVTRVSRRNPSYSGGNSRPPEPGNQYTLHPRLKPYSLSSWEAPRFGLIKRTFGPFLLKKVPIAAFSCAGRVKTWSILDLRLTECQWAQRLPTSEGDSEGPLVKGSNSRQKPTSQVACCFSGSPPALISFMFYPVKCRIRVQASTRIGLKLGSSCLPDPESIWAIEVGT